MSLSPADWKSARHGDATIAYADQGDGPALVLLPSLGRGAGDFDELAQLLAARGLRVIRPQPRGIGDSRGPMSGVPMQALAGDVAAVIEAERLAPVAVAGHAFGNFVARMLATDRPELVRAVALLAASPGRKLEGGSPYDPQVHASVYASGDLGLPDEERLAHLRRAFFAPGNDPSVWLGGWYPETKALQRGAQALTPVDTYFAAGTAPILHVQAAQDALVPPAQAGVLAQLLGSERVRVEVVQGASHALIPEQPQQVCDVLVAWMKSL